MSLRGMREVDFYIRGLGEDMMLPTGFQMIPCCVLSAQISPADFHLHLIGCHMIIPTYKGNWEIFLAKHIASLNKIKVL